VKRFGEYALALLLDLVGAAVALLVAGRTWQVVHTPRPRPLADDVLHLTGRTVDAASTALALVALAGVVAIVATRGIARRVVGAVIAAAGVGTVWRAIAAAGAVNAARARAFVREYHPTVPTGVRTAPVVTVTGSWPALTVGCGVLIALAGMLVAWRGHRWPALSARYENRGGDAPTAASSSPATADEDAQAAQARAVAAMWNALDDGDDPTSTSQGGPPER
jgi:uncharacterized membrane protein (TIGR02234 family)